MIERECLKKASVITLENFTKHLSTWLMVDHLVISTGGSPLNTYWIWNSNKLFKHF